MNSRSVEFGVGIFLIAGVLALVLLSLKVSGLVMNDSEGLYRVYATFQNVAGLAPRAKVTMAGVVVGRVTEIDLDTKTYMGRATLEISKDVSDLPIDSSASILTAGLLGEKYVGLTLGGDDSEFLKQGSTITDTQSALVLEELIGKFLMNSVNKKDGPSNDSESQGDDSNE